MKHIHRDIVAAVIISGDNKILLGMKAKGSGVYADHWHIPGGGIDAGETPEQALQREIQEEVGLDSTNADVSLLDDTGTGISERTVDNEAVTVHMTFRVYRVALRQPSDDVPITLSDDLVKTVWVSRQELRDYQLTPPSVELFTRIGWLTPGRVE